MDVTNTFTEQNNSNNFSEFFYIFYFWAVNVSSGFMLSASHNVLYFVLNWRSPVFHFLHFSSTFVFILIRILFKLFLNKISNQNSKKKYYFFMLKQLRIGKIIKTIYPPVLLQFFISLLSFLVYSYNRAGELYLLRIFDFLTTIIATQFKTFVFGTNSINCQSANIWSLLLPVAITGSLSWLEFGHIEFDKWTLMLAPVLAILQGIQIVLIKRVCINFENIGGSLNKSEISYFDSFLLIYSGLVSMTLLIPALISYSSSIVSYDASWESIDYLLMSMSIVFMASLKYSELWLQTNLKLYHFCALEHFKYFMGSCGQWYLQNMAHANIYAACGKLLFLFSIFRYWSGINVKDYQIKQSKA